MQPNAATLLGPDGPFAKNLPDYEHRAVQQQMAQLVEDSLRHQGIALCEAGTGTGKTLAYLVPAVLSGKRVVVSTGTRTLQDQIMQQDLPLLRGAGGLDVDAACMKGLSNYLCQRRYAEFMASPASMSSRIAPHLPVLENFAQTTTTGDRTELSTLPEGMQKSIFGEIQSSQETRLGPRCSYFETCHVTQMRKRAVEAQLVVVNHHLLFADLALKGAHGVGVIPDYDALIIDEAHLLEDIASEFFGQSLSSRQLEALLKDAERTLQRADVGVAAQRALSDVSACGHALSGSLMPYLGEEGTTAPLAAATLNGPVRQAVLALDDALYVLAGLCREAAGESESAAQLARRTERLRDGLATFVDVQDGGQVLWTKTEGERFTLGSSPVDVGGALGEHLYQRSQATVFTSATLSTSGNFEFIKERLGIDFEVDDLSLASPFDYDNAAALYLPPGLPDYRSHNFQDALVDHIEALVGLTGGGAFVLCTSLRAMRTLRKRCQLRLEVPVLMQGEASNAQLLESFRNLGNAVLFATMSFWQGVDVPGDALRLVVIDKLPFEVPTDPLVKARCDRLKAAGKNPFMEYVVPSAALTLKQGFGRLIRKRTDRGVVAILDPRLTGKGYGKVFLRSLPPARRCDTIEQLETFWQTPSA